MSRGSAPRARGRACERRAKHTPADAPAHPHTRPPLSLPRFGPYFVEPVVAGLSESGVPYISAMDVIGAPVLTTDFVVAGSSSQNLYGMAESRACSRASKIPQPTAPRPLTSPPPDSPATRSVPSGHVARGDL